jgi:DNA-binding response OmpR family regulator
MSTMAKILIVEDEKLVRESLAAFLSMHYDVDAVSDGVDALDRVRRDPPDLIVLDIGLPGTLDGIDVCRRLREQGFRHPILFLSSRHEEVDKLTSFGVGGDDYIVKPASLAEMDARIHAALRRCSGTVSDLARTVSWSSVVVNLATHVVTVDGNEVSLSAREMELLRYFVLHRGVVLSRQTLLEEVWHYDRGISSRTLDTHVLKLRTKLKDGHDGVRHFQTVRGVGYRFDV